MVGSPKEKVPELGCGSGSDRPADPLQEPPADVSTQGSRSAALSAPLSPTATLFLSSAAGPTAVSPSAASLAIRFTAGSPSSASGGSGGPAGGLIQSTLQENTGILHDQHGTNP